MISSFLKCCNSSAVYFFRRIAALSFFIYIIKRVPSKVKFQKNKRRQISHEKIKDFYDCYFEWKSVISIKIRTKQRTRFPNTPENASLSFAESVRPPRIFSVLTNSTQMFRLCLTDARYDGHSFHQPVELLLCDGHRVLFVPRPAKTTVVQTLI